MNIKNPLIFAPLLSSLFFPLTSGFSQGSLTPTGAPAPGMKSLAQIEPRTPVNTLLGDSSSLYLITQPGSYYLTTNIVVSGYMSAISINTNDVVLDLNGFTLYGSPNATVIRAAQSATSRVRILNGQIVGGAGGFSLNTISNVTVQDVQMQFNGASAYTYGINCREGARITRCSISGLMGSGSYAISTGDHGVLEQCDIESCNFGILMGSCATVRNCTVKSCVAGDALATGDESYIHDNLIDRCYSGITFNNACVVSHNMCQNGTGNGFNVSGSNSRVEDNTSIANIHGFITQSPGTNNVIIRNMARGNSYGNYQAALTDIVGPMVTSSGTITNINPWANFSL